MSVFHLKRKICRPVYFADRLQYIGVNNLNDPARTYFPVTSMQMTFGLLNAPPLDIL